jgi:hypothetical protein
VSTIKEQNKDGSWSLVTAGGQQGEQGIQGIDGAKGEKGDMGIQGLQGEKGTQGTIGVDGEKGDIGLTGQEGISIKGDIGLTGNNGTNGTTPIKGIDYFDGAKGEKGATGNNGYTPIKNVDYFDGAKGDIGTTGTVDISNALSYTTVKLNKDANKIFTEVDLKRSDSTLMMKSILSGDITPLYTTRTETYYALDGTTVTKTIIYTRTYDADGTLIGEVMN